MPGLRPGADEYQASPGEQAVSDAPANVKSILNEQ